jgi:hypothetical protein
MNEHLKIIVAIVLFLFYFIDLHGEQNGAARWVKLLHLLRNLRVVHDPVFLNAIKNGYDLEVMGYDFFEGKASIAAMVNYSNKSPMWPIKFQRSRLWKKSRTDFTKVVVGASIDDVLVMIILYRIIRQLSRIATYYLNVKGEELLQ